MRRELPTLEVAILCACEALGARYDAASCDCGLNLSVAVRHPAPPEPGRLGIENLLRPWLWRVSGVRTWATSPPAGAGKPAKAEAGSRILTPLRQTSRADSDLDSDLDLAAACELEGLLDAELHRLLALGDPAVVAWQPAAQAEVDGCRLGQSWHVQVAQAAHYPAPLPQLLNLSMIARAPFLKPNTRLVAAPVFEVELHGALAVCEPAAAGPCAFDGGFSWPYSLRWKEAGAGEPPHPGAGAGKPTRHEAGVEVLPWQTPDGRGLGLRLTLFVNETVVPKQVDGGWSGAPDWIPSSGAGQDHLAQDWRTTLEPRLAEGFDLAQRLVDWGRQWAAGDAADGQVNRAGESPQTAGRKPDAKVDLFLRRLRDGVVATLHDIAGLDAAADQKASPAARWAATLRRRLPELNGLAALQDDGLSSEAPLQGVAKELADLDLLQSSVALDTNLQRLAAASPAAAAGRGASPAAAARDGEPADLRQRLALANLDTTWPLIVQECRRRVSAGQEATSSLRDAIVWGLGHFARQRLGKVPAAPYAAYLPLTDDPPRDLLDDFARYLEDWGQCFVSRILLLDSGADGSLLDAVTPVPHGVTFPVGSIVPPATDHPGSRINGYGVLLRGPRKKTWRCLNIAALDVGERQAARGAVVPVPLHDSNGLSNAFVTYENFPLMAASAPQCRLTAAFRFAAPVDALPGLSLTRRPDPRLGYSYPLPPGAAEGDWGLVPPLIFRTANETYEALPFTVSNAGALPAEIARADDPTRLRRAAEAAPRIDAAPCKRYVRTFPYPRRVAIGEVQIVGGPATAAGAATPGPQDGGEPAAGPPKIPAAVGRLRLPEVPAKVLPLARDLVAGAFSPPAPGAAAAAGRRGAPLLLLAPAAWHDSRVPSRFTFDVRKPAIDLETWDRWVGIDDAQRPLRARVRAAWHEVAARRIGAKAEDGPWLDDPAVTGLEIEVAAIDDRGVPGKPEIRTFARTPISAAGACGKDLLEALRAAPVSVGCTAGGAAPLPGSLLESRPGDANAVEVTVPAGTVAQLRAFAIVSAADAARFAAEVLALGEKVTRDGADAWRFSAFSLLIETATDRLPTAGTLRRVLSSHFDAAAETLAFEVAREIDGRPEDSALLRYLGRAELLRQVWRWGGREISPFCFPPLSGEPGGAAGGSDPDDLYGDGEQACLATRLALWDVEGFGDRADADHLVVALPRGQRCDEPLFHVQENLAKDQRALYYRFAVRAYSRYEGLDLPGRTRVESWLPATLQPAPRKGQDSWVRDATAIVQGPPPAQVWHRRIVPCRQPLPVPKPVVRVVLPLTEAPGDAASCAGDHAASPGLLVVVNGAWYQFGGLAETLEAAVMTVEDPTDRQRQIWQIGPDPILTSAGADPSLAPAGNAGTCKAAQVAAGHPDPPTVIQDLRGPVGHTFDSSGAAPLITATTFVLPPPAGSIDFSWYFAKVRFRRILTAAGTAGGAAQSSDFTSPHWVQYLPAASCFDAGAGARIDVGSLSLETAGSTTLRLAGRKGSAVTPVLLRGGATCTLFLAVTRRIRNAAGGQEERFVGIFKPAPGGDWQPDDGKAVDLSGPGLRARVVEVQEPDACPAPPGDAGDHARDGGENGLWDALFPTQENADAAARIVRCSAPIDGAPLPARAGDPG